LTLEEDNKDKAIYSLKTSFLEKVVILNKTPYLDVSWEFSRRARDTTNGHRARVKIMDGFKIRCVKVIFHVF
jgi:hypothetical protein